MSRRGEARRNPAGKSETIQAKTLSAPGLSCRHVNIRACKMVMAAFPSLVHSIRPPCSLEALRAIQPASVILSIIQIILRVEASIIVEFFEWRGDET